MKSPSPDMGLQELRDQAEERLLQDAKLAFVRADYPEAVLLLNRFVKNHGQSPLALEGQWWLARAYEESGNLRLALGRFQRLAQDSINHPYRHEAGLRAQTLIEALGIEALPLTSKGVAVRLNDLQGDEEIAKVMSQIHQSKGAVLLISLGCPVHDQASEIIERYENESSNWGAQLGRGLGTLVKDAFRSGQAVYLGVSLPCLGVFAMGAREDVPQWHDWTFEPLTQRVRPSSHYSVLSSGYQSAVLDILSRMSRFKIAGIVFQEDMPFGPYEGFTPIAISSFEKAFKVHLDPASLFRRGRVLTRVEEGQEGLEGSYSDLFWKWAGWKSRERLHVMNELMQSLREQFPHLQFGVEIHPESLHAPVAALANFSEDWVETAHAPFDFFVARFFDSSDSGTQVSSIRRSQVMTRESPRSLVQRMVDYLGDPQKVWVIRQRQQDDAGPHSVLFNEELESRVWPEGVGEIVDLSPIP
jgi:hypothetical protein